MGEYAEMMLDGTCCQCCGEFLGGDEGYPVFCAGCAPEGTDQVLIHQGDGKSGRRRRKARQRARKAERARNVCDAVDMTQWKRLSESHFRRTVKEKNFDWWPSTGAWAFDGTVQRPGVKGDSEPMQKHLKELQG